MINNLLKKFCAEEVIVLVNHMEEHFEDFSGYTHSRWARILGACSEEDRLTLVERILVARVHKQQRKLNRRKQLLGEILKQKIDPKSMSIEDYPQVEG